MRQVYAIPAGVGFAQNSHVNAEFALTVMNATLQNPGGTDNQQ